MNTNDDVYADDDHYDIAAADDYDTAAADNNNATYWYLIPKNINCPLQQKDTNREVTEDILSFSHTQL